jgi:predicted lipid-binding transport protein (Tim44 family)
MGDGFQFLDIILFAAIAAFLVLRLRSVLGRRTGHEGRVEFDPFRPRKPGEAGADDDEKVIHLPESRTEGARTAEGLGDGPLETGLTRVKLIDPAFDGAAFLQGARGAFEMIITAFAQGDTKTLRPLLADEVYSDFAQAIEEREAHNQTLETTIVSVGGADFLEAEVQGRTAFVTVKFTSEQVNVTRDAEGRIVEGDASEVATITDIWTFARNTRSRDPNWALVATRSPN